MWRGVRSPVCPPACPTDSFLLKNSACNWQETFTQQEFVWKKNHCNSQPNRPRFQWTFPQKTASVHAWESDSVQFTDGDYLNM